MIDVRGLSCPVPVMMVQKEVENGAPAKIEVLTDCRTAEGNITRYAQKQGYQVSSAPEGDDIKLTLTK